MRYELNGKIDEIRNEFNKCNIVITVDSSKTSSGVIVGDLFGNVLATIRFIGKYSGTSDLETVALASDIMNACKVIFRGSLIHGFVIEDIVTVNKTGSIKTIKKGIEQHKSREKLTIIFSMFLLLAYNYYHVTPIIVNNNSWKSMVIPDEYRHGSDKWSVDYCRDKGLPFGFPQYNSEGKIDDICDAYCMYEYYFMSRGTKTNEISLINNDNSKLDINILSYNDIDVMSDPLELSLNNTISLEDNLRSARSMYKFRDWFIPISVDDLSYDMIMNANFIANFQEPPDKVYLNCK